MAQLYTSARHTFPREGTPTRRWYNAGIRTMLVQTIPQTLVLRSFLFYTFPLSACAVRLYSWSLLITSVATTRPTIIKP